ncbi:hypothetical protein [Nocardioides ungokensis]
MASEQPRPVVGLAGLCGPGYRPPVGGDIEVELIAQGQQTRATNDTGPSSGVPADSE